MASTSNVTGGSRCSKRKNLVMDSNVFVPTLLAQGKPLCSIHINLDGQIAVSCLDAGSISGSIIITPKPTFDLMSEELHAFLSQLSAGGCIVGLVTDKHIAEFVSRYANRLFETGKLQEVKYSFHHIGKTYDTLMIESSEMVNCITSDPSDGRKRLGQLKNWRVPAFFHDEISALSKPIFTLDVALNGAIRVRGSGLETEIEIPPKSSFDLMAQEVHQLISGHSVEGCVVRIVSDDYEERQFFQSFGHRLFQTGKLQDVKYTFHQIGKESMMRFRLPSQ